MTRRFKIGRLNHEEVTVARGVVRPERDARREQRRRAARREPRARERRRRDRLREGATAHIVYFDTRRFAVETYRHTPEQA